MSIETQKNFIGKTQTILLSATQSERWLSWVRLAVAAILALISVTGFTLSKTTLPTFEVQIGATALLICYSGLFLLRYNHKIIRGYFIYVLIALDVLVITLMLWSYVLSGSNISFITSAVYGAYFIVIIFTALHHRISLPLFCGALSAVGYTLLYYHYSNGLISASWLNDYAVRILMLLSAGGLCAMVSRNNSQTVKQVVSSEAKYHNLVHRLPEMLLTLDEKGNFIWSNMASNTILGIPAKVLPGRSLKSFFVNQEEFKLTDKGIKGTFEINDFNGTRKFVACIIQPIEKGSGGAVYDGLMADVTDRELAISQREEMVNRLFQYQKMESLGTLASGMAHDFNNILQSISDISSVVEHETSEEETQKRMKSINDSLADARFLVSELLALGRKKPLDYKSINLTAFLTAIVDQFSQMFGPRYSITLDVPSEPIWTQGDPDYLKRVFQNLFGNSKDAMAEGGRISVSCSFDKTEGENGVALIRCSDTGTGIPPEVVEKIFDPFFTTKKPGKGTGLGLALAQRIMMLHHGTISVESTSSKGTAFRMELPISQSIEAENDTKALLMNRQRATILLLDDDPKIREVLKFFLKEFSYPILEASTSNQAHEVLKANSSICKVLIMDWKLGNEDPHAVIEKLRGIKQDLIIIVVSGYPPVQKSIDTMNIHRWFTKPYDKNQLDIEIQRAIRGTKLQP